MSAERRVSVGGAEFWCRMLGDFFWVVQGKVEDGRERWLFWACFAPGQPVVPERIYVDCGDPALAALELERVRRELEGGSAPCGQRAPCAP